MRTHLLLVALVLIFAPAPPATAQPFDYTGQGNTQQFAHPPNWLNNTPPPTFGSPTTVLNLVSVLANSNRPLINNGATPFSLASVTFANSLGLATTLRGSPLTFAGPDAFVRVNTTTVPAAILNTITSDTAIRFLGVPGSQLQLRQLQGNGEFTFEGGTVTIDAGATFLNAVIRNATVVSAATNALPQTSGPRLFGGVYDIGSNAQTFSGPDVTLNATQQGSQIQIGDGGSLTLVSGLVIGTGDHMNRVTGAGSLTATASVFLIRGHSGANIDLDLSPATFSAPALRVQQTKMVFNPASATVTGPVSLEQEAVFFIGRPDVFNFTGGIGVDASAYLVFQNPLLSGSFANSIRAAGLVGGGRVLVYGGTFTLAPATAHNFSGIMTTWAEGSLVIDGPGTQTLSGANQLAGLTRVVAGTLNVTGSTGSGAVQVAGGTLTGTGTIGGAVSLVSGTLSPGAPTGTLTVDSLTLTGGRFKAVVEGPGATGRVRSNGAVALGSDTLLDVSNATGSFAVGDVVALIENAGTGPTTGTFVGLAEGAVAAEFSGLLWRISYAYDFAGDGQFNDVVLVAAPVPEPAAILLVSLTAALGARLWRRRAV